MVLDMKYQLLLCFEFKSLLFVIETINPSNSIRCRFPKSCLNKGLILFEFLLFYDERKKKFLLFGHIILQWQTTSHHAPN